MRFKKCISVSLLAHLGVRFSIGLICLLLTACLADRKGSDAGSDASTDVPTPDAPSDASRDTPAPDAIVDARLDAPLDAQVDTPVNPPETCEDLTMNCALPWAYLVTHDTQRFVRVSLAGEPQLCRSIELGQYLEQAEVVDGAMALSPCRLVVATNQRAVDIDLRGEGTTTRAAHTNDGHVSFAPAPNGGFFMNQDGDTILVQPNVPNEWLFQLDYSAITGRNSAGGWGYWPGYGLEQFSRDGVISTYLLDDDHDFDEDLDYRIRASRAGSVVLQTPGASSYWVFTPPAALYWEFADATAVVTVPFGDEVIRGLGGADGWITNVEFPTSNGPGMLRVGERSRDLEVLY